MLWTDDCNEMHKSRGTAALLWSITDAQWLTGRTRTAYCNQNHRKLCVSIMLSSWAISRVRWLKVTDVSGTVSFLVINVISFHIKYVDLVTREGQ